MKKNKKGFTIIELLAVIVLISLILVIVIPQVQKVSLNSKIKLCNTKMELITDAIDLWGQNNPNCFKSTTGCNILSNCSTNDNTISCTTTLEQLAQNNIIDYDKENQILNPITEKEINNEEIIVSYNLINKTVETTLQTTNICSKNSGSTPR